MREQRAETETSANLSAEIAALLSRKRLIRRETKRTVLLCRGNAACVPFCGRLT